MAAKKYMCSVGGGITTATGERIQFGPDGLLETSDLTAQKEIEAVAKSCSHVFEVAAETVAPASKPVA